MKNEVFEEILTKLKIEKDKLMLLRDIDAIILNNGIGIYPDIAHLRFLVTPKNQILVQHGISEPYGGRLTSQFQIKVGYTQLTFLTPKPVISDGISQKIFRNPKAGDILVVINDVSKQIIQYAPIIKTNNDTVVFSIFVNTPLQLDKDSLLCFYDPTMYNTNDCIHGTEIPGAFLKYIPNPGKNIKNYGVFHQTINIKDIKEIKLALKSRNTYSIS